MNVSAVRVVRCEFMAVAISSDPSVEYADRLRQRSDVVRQLTRLSDRLSWIRGLTFLAGVVLVIIGWNVSRSLLVWAFVPAMGFGALLIAHEGVDRRLRRARRAVRYYEFGLACLQGRWMTGGPTGARYLDALHPYSGDLDIFGEASLYQRICRARTRLGEDMLANWLSEAAPPDEIAARQEAVRELRTAADLRESLALLDGDVDEDIDQNRLRDWAVAPPQPVPGRARLTALFLGLAGVAAVVVWRLGWTGLSPLVIVILAEMAFTSTYGKRVRRVAGEADRAGSGLATLAHVLRLIESQQFESAWLRERQQRLETDRHMPSFRIAQLHQRIQNLNNALQNQFFAPVAFLLCLPVHLLHAVEQWRAVVGPHIPDWLTTVGEFEAAISLANYAYERPGDSFPEIRVGPPLLTAEGVAHPLLCGRKAVRNDVSLGGGRQVLLVSGSNMSGKSTLLRTVGINAVLAQAGAPVNAERFLLSPLQVGAAMRVHDSLQQGQSLFFAVIKRLKQIVDLSGQPRSLLFLLDEILQGTNSHDRRLGAEGVIRSLVEAGAIGFVTTHDLALTEIVSALGGRAENIHFEDRIEDGQMQFDYRIRPGVVQRSNALELMRLMGLRPPNDSATS